MNIQLLLILLHFIQRSIDIFAKLQSFTFVLLLHRCSLPSFNVYRKLCLFSVLNFSCGCRQRIHSFLFISPFCHTSALQVSYIHYTITYNFCTSAYTLSMYSNDCHEESIFRHSDNETSSLKTSPFVFPFHLFEVYTGGGTLISNSPQLTKNH